MNNGKLLGSSRARTCSRLWRPTGREALPCSSLYILAMAQCSLPTGVRLLYMNNNPSSLVWMCAVCRGLPSYVYRWRARHAMFLHELYAVCCGPVKSWIVVEYCCLLGLLCDEFVRIGQFISCCVSFFCSWLLVPGRCRHRLYMYICLHDQCISE